MNHKRMAGLALAGGMLLGGMVVAPTALAAGGAGWNAENIAWYASADGAVPVYRVYNPTIGLHHWTTSTEEYTSLVQSGEWRDEGVSFRTSRSGDPVYRLYDPRSNQHLWTLSQVERDALVQAGWNDEHVGWYVDPNARVAVLRVYNPATGEHLWTTSAEEYEALTGVQAPLTRDQLIAQARKDVEDRRAELDRADQTVRDAQARVDALSQDTGHEYSADALGYFQSVGATDAIKVLTDRNANKYLDYVKLGDAASASSLDNMIQAVKFIQEGNRLRAGEGQSELKVSDTLMAMAITSADANSADDSISHAVSSAFGGSSENLAWYIKPYSQWYDEEKANFNEIAKTDQELSAHRYDSYWVYKNRSDVFYGTKPVASCPNGYTMNGQRVCQTGHYLNLVDANEKFTGFGYASKPIAESQYFRDTTVSGRVVSADQYLSELEAFKAKYDNSDHAAQLAEARQTLHDAQARQASARQALQDAEKTLQNLTE